MAVDLSGIGYFNPIFTFVLVVVVIFAILNRTKIIGESSPIQAIVALVLGLIFASVTDVRNYMESVIPGFAVIVIALFFVIFLAAFGLKDMGAIMKPWLVWVFIGILAIVFIYQGYYHLNIPGNDAYVSISDWLHEGKVAGGLWLLIFAAITTFAITRKVSK